MSTNCTSCATGKSLGFSTVLANEAVCTACPLHCAECAHWTRYCTACVPGYALDNRHGCCPLGKVLNRLTTYCIYCNIDNCVSCDTDNICAICLSGYELLPSGKCSLENRKQVTITGTFNQWTASLDYFFSESIDLTALNQAYVLTYDRRKMEIIFTCFSTPVTDGINGKSCRNTIKFIDNKEVYNQDVLLNINQVVTFGDIHYVPLQSVYLQEEIRWYDSATATENVRIYSQVSSIAIQSVVGLTLFLLINVGINVLKLTQHIEIVVYMNVFYPSNLKVFLDFFSEDIIGMIFNPFNGMVQSRCIPPRSFAYRNIECCFLTSTGQVIPLFFLAIIIFTICRLLKKKLHFIDKMSKYFDLSWLAAVMDGLYFNVCLGAMVNLRMGNADGNGWGYLNLLLSALCIFGLMGFTAFGFYYSLGSPNMPHKRDKSTIPIISKDIDPFNGEASGKLATQKSISSNTPNMTIFSKLKNLILPLDIPYFYSHDLSDRFTGIL